MGEITRRGFVAGCCAGIAAMAGSRFNTVAFADPNGNEEILVVLFLRGGMDGLNFMPPLGGTDRGFYEAARPTLRVPTSGPGSALQLGTSDFGLHPSAAPLFDLYQSGHLSLVQAVGQTEANRSHFDAMQYIELGTPGLRSTPTGWLARYLATASNLPQEVIVPSLSVGDLQTTSLLGNFETLNMNSPDNYNLQIGPYQWRSAQRTALRKLYSGGGSWLHNSGLQSLNSLDVIELNVTDDYEPGNGAVYPETSFGEHLQVIAQMIKLELGLSVATLDLGGWDTHNGQGAGSGGFFATLVDELSRGLAAFYTDLDGSGASDYASRLTVVVQSEFGRRLGENADTGTDHGHGNVMMVLGGNTVGGIHGAWPGLDPGQLFDGVDLDASTDYRQVLSEILIRRMCNPNLATIFPGYSGYSPLGVVTGPDLPPVTGQAIFSDGFESGDVSAWTASVGG
ncbi:MAG: DUF1501 domain-containing protein [Deltaproteobacteria bacterium]|nr:DUF1501 domain-containing protein [Deltaproteobacteria bacterium]